MSAFGLGMTSSSDRRRATGSPTYVSEIGIVGGKNQNLEGIEVMDLLSNGLAGTSSMAAVRARQMARQREISSASARKVSIASWSA